MKNQQELLKNILARKKEQLERGYKMNFDVRIVKRISPKSKKEYEAIEVLVGERWRQLLFPKSNFEWDYLKEHLEVVDLTKNGGK